MEKQARRSLAVDKVAFDGREGRLISHYGLIYRPVDKRENYIKRCVGLPGDILEVKNSICTSTVKGVGSAKPGFAL